MTNQGSGTCRHVDDALWRAAEILRVPADRLEPEHLLQLGERLMVCFFR